ncbi:ephrin domain, partial [Paramuricea clavata]
MDRKLCLSFLALVLFIREAHLTYYPTVFWTPTNCRFNLNKLNGEGYFIKVKYFSNMYFMCPHISIWAGKSDMSPHSRMMHENIILVDEESYKSCSIKNVTHAKTLLKCDADPVDDSAKYSKEHFASVQASPDKQCYNMGQHYYFISTSDGSAESLNHTEGGHCQTHHMKLHIYVCNEN